jgi:Family of unknown function (DUF6807)/3-keto-disaccharide hydrolase
MQKPISLSTHLIVVLVLSLCLLLCSSVTYGRLLARITVEAGDYTRTDTPVAASLGGVPLGFPQDPIHLVEVKGSERIEVPVQFEAGSPPRLWWVLSGTTQAGDKRMYELMEGAGQTVSGVTAVLDDKVLQIRKGGTKVLNYNHAVVPGPVGKSKLYDRSGFIHPLWSPTGSVLTNIHPKDHPHHLGIWMPWTHTEFEGKPVDFWNLGEGQGTVRFKRFISTTSGPVYGGFQAEQEHVALKTDPKPKVVLDEIWDVRVYNVGGPEKGYWLWDFASTQRCVADSPLKLLKYRYGGFGFRGAAEWDGENASYLTSEGKTRKNGHATRARWCDTAGVSDGQWKGVTHFSNPQNFRHPEPMRIWPSGQVFFGWAPEQLGPFEMKPGEDHLFRYRLYVHEGKIDVARTEQLWNDYAHPPKTSVELVRPTNAIVLFDGADFSKWTAERGGDIGWRIVDHAMQVVPGTGSIMTRQNFRDFRMHAEFKTPLLPPDVKGQGRGNSGIYIQRRYEVQILDSFGLPLMINGCGSLYRFKAPDKNVCDMPGRWQSYDIIFHAARYEGNKKVENARITVWQNGVLVQNNVELENKTGAGRPEGPEPEPILLQEHHNKVWFRNIWIQPL